MSIKEFRNNDQVNYSGPPLETQQKLKNGS